MRLMAAGREVVTTRQPGGTALGDGIRRLLLDSRAEASVGAIAPVAELTLMFADRAQAVAEVIEPALGAGRIVLCDRFTDSSEAYQGAGRELGSARVLALHRAVCGSLQPDLTLMLLPELATCLMRARRRNARQVQQSGADENRFEREGDEFYRRIYGAYEAIAAREPERVAVVRENGGVSDVEHAVWRVVAERMGVPA